MDFIRGISSEDEDSYTYGIAPDEANVAKRGWAIHQLINRFTTSLDLLFVL